LQDEADFEEFPNHPGLQSFDRSDRKFVAVAVTHQKKPHIRQAVDAKWWGWYPSLRAVGVEVDFLCPTEIRRPKNGTRPRVRAKTGKQSRG
jgi:hypothetical protein